MRQWKTALTHTGNAVTKMNELEREGYTVEHVFGIEVEESDPSHGSRHIVQRIFISAVRKTK